MVSQAVILAGGMGTRLKPWTDEHPKPMIPIGCVPFLEHLVRQLAAWGFKEVLLLLGYRPGEIMDYFGSGERLGVKIIFDVTPVEYDTGARIRAAEEKIHNEFLLLYCDNYCPLDFKCASKQFGKSGNLIQVTAYANKDGYTKSNLRQENGRVLVYDRKRVEPQLNGVDIGYAFVRKETLRYLPEGNCNFEAVVYPELVRKGRMGCFVTEHRYYSIGSWARMELTREFFRPKKVVFLDRDGTLNERPAKACYVEREDDFRWLPNAREAVKLLHDRGYQIYLVTNQPGIARGVLSSEQLDCIHDKMRRDLQSIGADIDEIYICPHGWDDGCDCRKPRPGMLYQAQKNHSLDLTQCILIGDDVRDIQAGEAAGLKHCILLKKGFSLWDAVQGL